MEKKKTLVVTLRTYNIHLLFITYWISIYIYLYFLFHISICNLIFFIYKSAVYLSQQRINPTMFKTRSINEIASLRLGYNVKYNECRQK